MPRRRAGCGGSMQRHGRCRADAETMRRRAGELLRHAEVHVADFDGLPEVFRRTTLYRDAVDTVAILRAVAAGYIVTDTPDGLVPAEYLREGAAVLVVSADGVG